MTIDRAPKPCLHKRANHEHGSYACYVLDRCRCLPCCFASSEYDRQLKRRNAYGRSNYVDAAPARAHVATLMAAGVGLKQIVKKSGIPQGALWKLVYGKKRPDGTQTPSRRITRQNEDRLLALDPSDRTLLADGARVDPTGTRRRLQALACLGWSINRLADESGLDRQRLDHALHGGQAVVSTVTAVVALYERLWDQPAPARDHREKIAAARAINRARNEGWAPPAAWDDDTIDDPAAEAFTDDVDEDLVDELALDQVCDGHRLCLTGATLDAAIERMAAADIPRATMASRLQLTETQLYRQINRLEQQRRRAAA